MKKYKEQQGPRREEVVDGWLGKSSTGPRMFPQ